MIFRREVNKKTKQTTHAEARRTERGAEKTKGFQSVVLRASGTSPRLRVSDVNGSYRSAVSR